MGFSDEIFARKLQRGGRGDGPAPQSSALARAAAALSANQWGTLTVDNQLNCDPNGSGDGMHSFSPQHTVDTLHNILHFWGGVHGAPNNIQRMHHGTFDAVANAWAGPSTPPTLGSSTGGVHAYYSGTVDQQTGDFYAVAPFLGVQTIYKRAFVGGAWSTALPACDGASAATCAALVYHPSLYGGHGGLIHASQRGIWTLDPRAGSPAWTQIVATFPAMAQFQGGVYDYKTTCAYVGGADGDGGNFYQIAAHAGAGVATTKPHPSMGLNTSGGDRILVASGNPSNSMVLFNRSGVAEQFDGTAWSSVTANAPASMLNASDQWWSGGAWPAHGCIVFSKGERSPGPKTSTTLHIWKR